MLVQGMFSWFLNMIYIMLLLSLFCILKKYCVDTMYRNIYFVRRHAKVRGEDLPRA